MDFTQVDKIDVGDKTVDYITIGGVVAWEYLRSVTLTASSTSVVWGTNVTLTATTSPARQNLTIDFGNGLKAVTNQNGVATVTVKQTTPQSVTYQAKVRNKSSSPVTVNWNKRNLTLTKKHTGTLYYGHYLRFVVTDSTSGAAVSGLTGYIVDGYTSTQTSVTSNGSGVVQKQCNNGTKGSTTSSTKTAKCKINGGTLYNNTSEYSGSYTYQPSAVYNARISAASTDSRCTATHGGSEVYAKWYKSSTAESLPKALYSTGSVHSYLATADGSSFCARPEELYAKTDGKDHNGKAKSGTVHAIEYYMTAARTDSTKPIVVKGFSMTLQIYSSGEWVTKQTLSKTTTLTGDSQSFTGKFSTIPTMSQLTSGYVRFKCYFNSNTSHNYQGYVYVYQLYPHIYYSPAQTFA